MDIRPITGLPCNDLYESLGRLIETVGTPRFNTEFLRISQQIAGATHIAAFSVADQSLPQLVLAADREATSAAYAATNAYLARFWQQDPVNRRPLAPSQLANGVAIRMPAAEFERIPYRRACYTFAEWSAAGSNLFERISLLRKRDDTLIRVDFYRRRADGAYADADFARLAADGDLALSLVARHARSTVSAEAINTRAGLEQLIRRLAPDLPGREVQVCAGIALGMSSEAIANALAIGINTVLTYRKRAYSRLGISSHNELVRRVFAAAPAIGLDETEAPCWPLRPKTAEHALHN